MKFSIELQLIIQLLQIHLGNGDELSIQESVPKISSWNRFVSLVIRHRLVAVIYTLLNDLSIILPEEEAYRLKHHFDIERKKNFILNASLVKLNEVIEKEIKVLWFKGAVQSQRMYNNPLLRSYADLDLYIDKKDLLRLDSLLRSQGYMPLMDWKRFSKSHFSKYSEFIKEMAYIHEKTKVCIDVHWNLVMSKELFPYTFQQIYERGEHILIHNKKFKTLNEFDNFIYLNIHGCFDHWKTISQLFDVTHIAKNHSNFTSDFSTFLDSQKLHSSLSTGLELSDYIFNETDNSSKIQNEFVQLFELPFLEIETGKLDRLQFFKRQWCFSNTLNYKVNCFESNFFYGDNNELWRLPRQLFWLYYFSVPFRWLGRKIRHKKTLS